MPSTRRGTRIDPDHAVITVVSDAPPEHHAEVCRAIVNILIDLARADVLARELDAARGCVTQVRPPLD